MGSAKVSARMVTYSSWNDHDNFEGFIVGNRIPLLYRSVSMSFTLHVFISTIQTQSNKFSEDLMTALR